MLWRVEPPSEREPAVETSTAVVTDDGLWALTGLASPRVCPLGSDFVGSGGWELDGGIRSPSGGEGAA